MKLREGIWIFDAGTPEAPAAQAPESKNDSLPAAVVEELALEKWSGRRESNPRLILGKAIAEP